MKIKLLKAINPVSLRVLIAVVITFFSILLLGFIIGLGNKYCNNVVSLF